LCSSLLSKNKKIKIYRTIILPVVLYGCKTWSHTLTEECRLRVFKNRVLRRIFGPKRVEVTGEWKRLYNEQLNDLYASKKYYSGDQSMQNEMGGACNVWVRGEGHKVLVGKPEGIRTLVRCRNRWQVNIKMYIQDVRWEGMDWTDLARNRDRWQTLVNAVTNLWVA